MKLLDIVLEVFPEYTKEEAVDALWSKTSFPFDNTKVREQLLAAKALQDAGKEQCDFCSEEASPGTFTCPSCAKTLSGS